MIRRQKRRRLRRTRRRRSKRPKHIIIGFILVIIAFGLGSSIGISMGFNGDNQTNITQNNTTHLPVDVTHNISLYENRSIDNFDESGLNQDTVVEYTASNNTDDTYYSDYDDSSYQEYQTDDYSYQDSGSDYYQY